MREIKQEIIQHKKKLDTLLNNVNESEEDFHTLWKLYSSMEKETKSNYPLRGHTNHDKDTVMADTLEEILRSKKKIKYSQIFQETPIIIKHSSKSHIQELPEVIKQLNPKKNQAKLAFPSAQ